MAVGLPLKTTYANGDVYSASDVNDTNGTVNLLNPTAKGSIVSASAANTPSRLAVGTDGQVLVADSTATTGLKWSTSTAGGMTLLSTTTLSGASTTISSINQTYYNLQVVLEDVTVSSAAEVSFRINNNTTQHYQYYLNGMSTTVGQISASSGSLTGAANMDAAASGGKANWSVLFNNYASGKRFGFQGVGLIYKPGWCSTWFAGGTEAATAMTSLVILASAGNLAGTVKIYGVK